MGVDTTKFTKKVDLANSTSNVDKLDNDTLKTVPSNLSNLNSIEDKLHDNKLVPMWCSKRWCCLKRCI